MTRPVEPSSSWPGRYQAGPAVGSEPRPKRGAALLGTLGRLGPDLSMKRGPGPSDLDATTPPLLAYTSLISSASLHACHEAGCSRPGSCLQSHGLSSHCSARDAGVDTGRSGAPGGPHPGSLRGNGYGAYLKLWATIISHDWCAGTSRFGHRRITLVERPRLA